MKEIINKIQQAQRDILTLKPYLHDKEFWIKKAQEETDFVPDEESWIHVEVSIYKIEISVYSKKSSKHWINGDWYDSSFADYKCIQL